MPVLHMLIGVPASGKSTWIKNQKFDPATTIILSTDAIIEEMALAEGKTYSDIFDVAVKEATKKMNETMRAAIADKKNVVWDQTNTTAKVRKGRLSQFSKGYDRVAVFFVTPNQEELDRRLDSRPGKHIPTFVMNNMMSSLEFPTLDEGFDQILKIDFTVL